jgi:hypothetical protein
MNNFEEQLKFSEQASHEPFWQAVYEKAFPDMVNNMVCTGKNTNQCLGIDRVIQLKSGKTLYVDEKKRTKVYSDILLEYISNDKTNAPGWMEKDLQIDYLAYAFMPTKRCYLYPWQMLRRAWINYKDCWIKNYGTQSAPNKYYNTLSVAVPIEELNVTVKRAMIIQL